jgi:hypothetical protein
MNLLALEYDKINGVYTYSFSKNAPSNCKPIEYSSFFEIDLKGQFILFIGSIWSGNVDVRVAEFLGEIACKYPKVNFYFRIVLDESENDKIVPKGVVFTHLPIVLFVKDSSIDTISTGPISKVELGNRIEPLLMNSDISDISK